MGKAFDIRDQIFLPAKGIKFLASITSQGDGIVSGTLWVRRASRTIGIELKKCKKDGQRVHPSGIIADIEGDAKQIALAEEEFVGWMAKASGIATAARKARTAAGKKLRVVSGAWKKMPPPLKELVRQAISDGGIPFRISEKPFIYLDKNYVKMLGGIREALVAVEGFKPFIKVVQLKSKGQKLLREATLAAKLGAAIIMIDTGEMEDIGRVHLALKEQGLRKKVSLAFAGEISVKDLAILRRMPVDIVDIGKAIVDAPLLDMRLDVVRRK